MTWRQLLALLQKDYSDLLDSPVTVVMDGKHATIGTTNIDTGIHCDPNSGLPDTRLYLTTPDDREWKVLIG